MSLIVPIVEGHGEVDALPVLLKRIGLRTHRFPTVNPPYRVKASSFLKFDQEFRRVIQLATAKAAGDDGTVLILLDCEDGCPAKVGPEILAEARTVRSDIPIVVCLAYREYETWFIEAIESLAGIEGIPQSIRPPAEATSMRGEAGSQDRCRISIEKRSIRQRLRSISISMRPPAMLRLIALSHE